MTTNPLLHFEAGMPSPDPEQVRWQLSRVKWDFSGFVPSAGISGIHSLHWYPAPFPPALAATLLDILGSRGGVFLDPFSGSGVAPLEAWLRGYRVTGIDNNQFAVDLCRAKARLLQRGTAATGQSLAAAYRKYRRSHLFRWLRRSSDDICKAADIQNDATRWFTKDVLAEIGVTKNWLGDLDAGLAQWRDVARIVFSSLLHGKLSTVRNYHYTYIVDRSRVGKRALGSVDVEALFVERLVAHFIDADYTRARLARTGTAIEALPEPQFHRGLAQDLEAVTRTTKADMIVTSPPYFGMNDYVRSQYLTWLIFPWQEYEAQIASESGSRRARNRQSALDDYFSTIERTFRALRAATSPGKYVAVVMGNSGTALARQSNPTQTTRELVTRIGFQLVWEVERRIRFRKINNTPYRTESIWVFSR